MKSPSMRSSGLGSDKIAEKKIVGLAIPKFEETNRQAIADIPADTSTALTGSEIGRYLRGYKARRAN
jgi:hypothetical protein